MVMRLTIDYKLLMFNLPPAVEARLQKLLDRQDQGIELSAEERREAEGLVELAEFLSLLKRKAQTIPLSQVMDKISDKAETQDLTPELLEALLDKE